MKKILIAFILVGCIFALSPAAAASDIDGIWGLPGSFDILFMARENNDVVIMVVFDLAFYAEPYDYEAYVGTQSGSVINLVSTEFTPVDLDATVYLTSPNTATVYIDRCEPVFLGCLFPTGSLFQIIKLF